MGSIGIRQQGAVAVDAASVKGVAGVIAFAGAVINHGRIELRDGNRATEQGRVADRVKILGPVLTTVNCLPQAAAGRGNYQHAVVAAIELIHAGDAAGRELSRHAASAVQYLSVRDWVGAHIKE